MVDLITYIYIYIVGGKDKLQELVLSVIKASLSVVVSTLSSIPSLVAMSLFSLWIACVVSGSAFL